MTSIRRSFGWLPLLLTLIGLGGAARAQVKVTFDALAPGNGSIVIPGGYGNLQWLNFAAYNGANRPATEGYHTGMISPNNVAFNLSGDPASIQRSSIFHLGSAYLTAAFQPNMQVSVQGFIGTNLVYSNAYVLNPTGPVLVQFNHAGVDKVSFTAIPATQFVMDDLVFTPEVTNAPCAFAIDPVDGVYAAGPETGTINVSASPGCAWHVWNSIPWVSILSSTMNTGNGTVIYQVQSNSTGFPRDGTMIIAGQLFAITQLPSQAANLVPINLGNVEVSQIGHRFVTNFPGMRAPYSNLVLDYFVDQNQDSGGGGTLQPVAVDWNTNHQFTLSVSAPAGKMFLLQVPPSQSVKFGGFLWWQSSSGGGISPPGTVKVSFVGLQGTPADFSQSTSVLSDSHGFFGFADIDSSPFTQGITFSSIVITGTAAPQYVLGGGLTFTPHMESSLQIACTASGANDPGPVLTIVPQVIMATAPHIALPNLSSKLDDNGDLTITFVGALQSSTSPNGPFFDVPGHPLGTFFVPKASQSTPQFFRVRDIY